MGNKTVGTSAKSILIANQETRTPQRIVRALKRVPILELFVIATLLLTACGRLAAPASPKKTASDKIPSPGGETNVAPRPQRTPGNDTSTLLRGGPGRRVEFEQISLEQGLSQSVVPCILQDSKGFMWFCTQDGLNRYDGYEFQVYKHDPGEPDSLGDNLVQSIVEDREGSLWIGTNGSGLDRFDRKTERFIHYHNDPDDPHSLSSNDVQVVYLDREGDLWIGTNGGGLDKLVLSDATALDGETARFVHYQNDPDDPDSLSGNNVQAILEDRAAGLWVATGGGGLNRLFPSDAKGSDHDTKRFLHYQNDPDDPHSLSNDNVQALFEDQAGGLWVGTGGGGLDRLVLSDADGPERETAQFVHQQNDPGDPHSLSNNTVQAIYQDGEGTLWIGTNSDGLDSFDPQTGHFTHHRNEPGDPRSLSNNNVQSIYEDGAGVLWVGTFGGGLDKYDPRKQKFTLYQADPSDPQGLSGSIVWSIYQDREGVLWVGTAGQGLNRLVLSDVEGSDRDTGQFTHYLNDPDDPSSLSDNTVWSVYHDRQGVLWFGTSVGLDRFDRHTEEFTHYDALPIFSIDQDREGVLWVGTGGGGLGRFDRETEQFTFYQNDPAEAHSLSDDTVVSVRQDREGVLWVGTFNGGLDRFDRDTEQFIHYQHDPGDPHSLSHNTILSIYQDQEGTLWVGTAGGGLNKFDRATETFTHYREIDGLANDYVYGILEDDAPPEAGGHNLWLSTNSGLSKFNPRTETFRNYDVGDGLQSNEFNMGAYDKGGDGEMFFGGVNGFNTFYPDSVTDNPYVPPIVITDFQLFNESVKVGGDSPLQASIAQTDDIQLTYKDDFFAFEFAALHYSAPQENQFAYMMEGLDKDWNDVGTRRFAGYTNVPPGEYVFRVKGTNSDGVWNQEGTFVRIVVTPPFWQTWWFRILMAVLVVGGAFGAVTWRIRSIEAQRRQLEIQVDARTKELRETLAELERAKEAAEAANLAKSVFLANMSHELRTPLNAILGFTQLMDRETNLTAWQQENLRIINRSGEHLLGLINDVLELSKIEAGRTTLNEQNFDLHRLLDGLEDMFRLRAKDKGLALIFERAPEVPQYVRADIGKLRQVLMNLLGNAVKFTGEGGVTLRVGAREEEPMTQDLPPSVARRSSLVFEVHDTGPGIAAEEMAAVFDPFVQTASGQQSQEGTGLGLPISQQFAHLMGGDITLSSELGQGSVFRFETRVGLVDADAVRTAQPTHRVVGLEPGQPTYRLLAVDDKEVNRKLLVRLLAPLGFEVREAANGHEAIEIWERWEPHLIWMDMRMPVMDGYEATRRIKATTKGQATVIIALTASALEEDRAVILSEGCDDYIRKPFHEADLFDVLARHLGVRLLYHEIEPGERDRRPGVSEETVQPGLTVAAGRPIPPHADAKLVEGLAAMSADWMASLQQATILGDLGFILTLVDHIGERDPSLSEALAALAHNFDHDRILMLIQQAGEQHE